MHCLATVTQLNIQGDICRGWHAQVDAHGSLNVLPAPIHAQGREMFLDECKL